jgi:hypothetical protein
MYSVTILGIYFLLFSYLEYLKFMGKWIWYKM